MLKDSVQKKIRSRIRDVFVLWFWKIYMMILVFRSFPSFALNGVTMDKSSHHLSLSISLLVSWSFWSVSHIFSFQKKKKERKKKECYFLSSFLLHHHTSHSILPFFYPFTHFIFRSNHLHHNRLHWLIASPHHFLSYTPATNHLSERIAILIEVYSCAAH